jgi:hypothetical protein
LGSFSGRLLLAASGLTLAFRFWLAAVMPITGDEAYFIEWGRYPDWGFYDHPPMIGWWLAALLFIADAEWWLRLPQVFQPLLLALAVRWAWLRLWPDQRDYRDWVALLVMLAPVNVWNIFVTTDTALVYFAVLSGLAWLRATRDQEDDSPRWYLVAGLFLAGAVLSKYFAALLGFAYLVDVLMLRTRGAWRGLFIAYACTVPGLLLMAWWNHEWCWSNYMFNFINRHEANPGLQWKTPLLYPAMLLYILTPPVIWALLRRPVCRPASADFSPDRSLLVLTAVPLLLFALLSLVKSIGLHWVLAFVPFALMLATRRLTSRGVQKLTVFFLGFAALHVALAVGVLRLPLETWRSIKLYPGIVLTFESRELVERANPGETLLASDGYSNAATLGYNLRRYVPVLGPGSGHARHDDILTDWRVHDGRDITLLRKTMPSPDEQDQYGRWFRSIAIDSFDHRGARFWVVRGQNFDYATYRDTVLAEVRRRYYAVPDWLPLHGCYFCDRYFPENTCRR